jgi:hypothetical protein
MSRAGRIEAAVWTYRGWVCMLGKVLGAGIADPCKVGYEEETIGVLSTMNFLARTNSLVMTRERAAAKYGPFRVANTRDPIAFAEAPRHPPTVAAFGLATLIGVCTLSISSLVLISPSGKTEEEATTSMVSTMVGPSILSYLLQIACYKNCIYRLHRILGVVEPSNRLHPFHHCSCFCSCFCNTNKVDTICIRLELQEHSYHYILTSRKGFFKSTHSQHLPEDVDATITRKSTNIVLDRNGEHDQPLTLFLSIFLEEPVATFVGLSLRLS